MNKITNHPLTRAIMYSIAQGGPAPAATYITEVLTELSSHGVVHKMDPRHADNNTATPRTTAETVSYANDLVYVYVWLCRLTWTIPTLAWLATTLLALAALCK